MIKKPTVAVDLDGVLCNFHYSFTKIANEMFNTPIITDINEVKAWNWWEWYPLTKAQHELVWQAAQNTYNWWTTLDPLIDSSVFKLLHSMEYTCSLFFVTHRIPTEGYTLIEQVYAWLNRYVAMNNFSVIPVVEPKGKVLKAIGADYFIDDKPENVMDAIVEAPECKNYILVRRYNTFALEFMKKSNIYRDVNIIYSVEGFLNDIKGGMENG